MESYDHIIVWAATALVFVMLKQFWIKKRSYFIVTGILFFSPTPIYYSDITGHVSLWPLIGTIPVYLTSWATLDLWIYYLLPTIFLLAWFSGQLLVGKKYKLSWNIGIRWNISLFVSMLHHRD